MKAIRSTLIIGFIVLILSGCAGPVKNMQVVQPGMEITQPDQGKALVIFFRTSVVGGAIQSSVFDIVGDECKIVGLVAAKKKVAFMAEPGEHLFMTVGESADFMSANLEEGKTYYVEVVPRMGAFKARFSLAPIHKEEVESEKFMKSPNACQYVEMNGDSYEWANRHMEDIQSKREFYYAKWMNRDEESRPRLLPEDGV